MNHANKAAQVEEIMTEGTDDMEEIVTTRLLLRNWTAEPTENQKQRAREYIENFHIPLRLNQEA